MNQLGLYNGGVSDLGGQIEGAVNFWAARGAERLEKGAERGSLRARLAVVLTERAIARSGDPLVGMDIAERDVNKFGDQRVTRLVVADGERLRERLKAAQAAGKPDQDALDWSIKLRTVLRDGSEGALRKYVGDRRDEAYQDMAVAMLPLRGDRTISPAMQDYLDMREKRIMEGMSDVDGAMMYRAAGLIQTAENLAGLCRGVRDRDSETLRQVRSNVDEELGGISRRKGEMQRRVKLGPVVDKIRQMLDDPGQRETEGFMHGRVFIPRIGREMGEMILRALEGDRKAVADISRMVRGTEVMTEADWQRMLGIYLTGVEGREVVGTMPGPGRTKLSVVRRGEQGLKGEPMLNVWVPVVVAGYEAMKDGSRKQLLEETGEWIDGQGKGK